MESHTIRTAISELATILDKNMQNAVNHNEDLASSSDFTGGNPANEIDYLNYFNVAGHKVMDRLAIATGAELAPCVAHENDITAERAIKEYHIKPKGLYFEDADLNAVPDKPLTHQSLLKRMARTLNKWYIPTK